MSSVCGKPEGPSSGRQLYIQLWYRTFYTLQYKQFSRQQRAFDIATYWTAYTDHIPCTIPYHNCIHSRHPNAEHSGSKYVEGIKIKISNVNFDNVHFVGVYCIIIKEYTVQKHKIQFITSINTPRRFATGVPSSGSFRTKECKPDTLVKVLHWPHWNVGNVKILSCVQNG